MRPPHEAGEVAVEEHVVEPCSTSSMRPPHEAGEVSRPSGRFSYFFCLFNEAPARGGGGPYCVPSEECSAKIFNEAPARGGGGPDWGTITASCRIFLQ